MPRFFQVPAPIPHKQADLAVWTDGKPPMVRFEEFWGICAGDPVWRTKEGSDAFIEIDEELDGKKPGSWVAISEGAWDIWLKVTQRLSSGGGQMARWVVRAQRSVLMATKKDPNPKPPTTEPAAGALDAPAAAPQLPAAADGGADEPAATGAEG